MGEAKKMDQKLDKNYGRPLRGRHRWTKKEPKRATEKSSLNEEIINDKLQYFLDHSSLVYLFTAFLLIFFAGNSLSKPESEFDHNFLQLILGIFSALMALTLYVYAWLDYSFFIPYLFCLCIHTYLLLYRSAKTAHNYYEYRVFDCDYVCGEIILLVYNLLCAIFATKLYIQFEFLARITATEPETIRLGERVYQIDKSVDPVVYRLKD